MESYREIKETKKRSFYKALSWRIIATLNSFTILTLHYFESNLYQAILMNITGFIIFYIFERVWNRIKYGRYYED